MKIIAILSSSKNHQTSGLKIEGYGYSTPKEAKKFKECFEERHKITFNAFNETQKKYFGETTCASDRIFWITEIFIPETN